MFLPSPYMPPSCTCHCFIHNLVHYDHVHYCMLFHLALYIWGVVNFFFSFLYMPPSCTCHCFIHHLTHYCHIHYCMLFHLSLCAWWCSKLFFISLHTTILHMSSHYHHLLPPSSLVYSPSVTFIVKFVYVSLFSFAICK